MNCLRTYASISFPQKNKTTTTKKPQLSKLYMLPSLAKLNIQKAAVLMFLLYKQGKTHIDKKTTPSVTLGQQQQREIQRNV